jgi:hypothetical protein
LTTGRIVSFTPTKIQIDFDSGIRDLGLGSHESVFREGQTANVVIQHTDNRVAAFDCRVLSVSVLGEDHGPRIGYGVTAGIMGIIISKMKPFTKYFASIPLQIC